MKLLSGFHYDCKTRRDGLAFLTADLVLDLQKGYQGYHEFASLEDGTFATLENDIFTLFKGMTWDLCSPSIVVKGKRFGTPSGYAEAFGSAVHDSSRRIMRLSCSPFKRKDTDDFFWDALGLMNSKLQKPYHWAVKSFIGTVFIWITKGPVDCYCRKCSKP